MSVSQREIAPLESGVQRLKSAVEWQKLALAERDRRIAELEGLFVKIRGRHMDHCKCEECLLSDATLAGKGAVR